MRRISRREVVKIALTVSAGLSAFGRGVGVAEPSASLASELRKELNGWLRRAGDPWATG